MEPTGDDWQNVMRIYIRSVENLTQTSLKQIKRDRNRNHLPFDDAFQKYFLQKINGRIADVYTDFLLDENLEVVQGFSSQDRPNYENGYANVFEMPIILEQPNNQNANAPFVQNNNQMPEQIIISIPSNPLPIPLDEELNETPEQEQESHAKSTQTDIPGTNGAKRKPRMEIASRTGENEPLIESEPNKNNENLNTVCDGGGGLGIESTSTGVNNVEMNELFGRMTDSNIQQFETVGLTLNQTATNSTLDGEQNDNAMPNNHAQFQDKLQKRTVENLNEVRASSKNDAHATNEMTISTTAAELLNTQQRIENDVNDGLPLRNVAEESYDSQHSEIITPSNGNEEVNTADDDLELAIKNGGASAPNEIENNQIRPAVLSKILTELNSQRTSSSKSRIVVPGFEDVNQRNGVAVTAKDIPNLRYYPELIDLISDDEEAASQVVNNVPKNVQNAAGQSRPTIQRRKRENNNENSSGCLKKMSKVIDKVDTMKRHKCNFCEYSTNIKSRLNDHIRTHTNERPYECEVCEKRFTQKAHLNGHMKTHSKMFQFHCSKCHQGFTHQALCKLHESRCKAKQYECHLCKRNFIRKDNLAEHMRKHTGEKLRCLNCRKQFGYVSSLQHHMKSHAKLFRFQCSNCRQGFSDKELWKLHESRCKAKQYECYLCSKKFYQHKGHLLVHMRHIHTGEKPFSCSDCRKQFHTKYELASHTKSQHNKSY